MRRRGGLAGRALAGAGTGACCAPPWRRWWAVRATRPIVVASPAPAPVPGAEDAGEALRAILDARLAEPREGGAAEGLLTRLAAGRLEQAGCNLLAVGRGPGAVPLAVAEAGGRPVLAVECDAAAGPAREWRLRDEALEARGWRVTT